MITTHTTEGKSSTRGASLTFQGVTAAINRLTRTCCADGHRLELRGPVVRVRAKGQEMVWRAETDRGTRWVSFDDGKWSISKVEPPRKNADEPRAA